MRKWKRRSPLPPRHSGDLPASPPLQRSYNLSAKSFDRLRTPRHSSDLPCLLASPPLRRSPRLPATPAISPASPRHSGGLRCLGDAAEMAPKRSRATQESLSGDESEDQSEDSAQENFEQENKKKSAGLGTRCVPSDVYDTAKSLSSEAKDLVRDSGFGGILDINVTRCFSVDRILYLMSKCDVSSEDESFTIVLSEDNKIKVTPERVKHVFGIPDVTHDGVPAGGSDPATDESLWNTKWEQFWQLLKNKGYKDMVLRTKVTRNGKISYKETKVIKVEVVQDYIKSVQDKHDQARAFFCIVLCRLLIPTLSNYIIRQHVGMCSDLDWVKKFNWCKFVCQDLKNKITSWQKKSKTKIEGNVLLLMICFIRTLEPQREPEQPSVEPLIKLYDNSKIEKLLGGLKDIQEIRAEVAKYKPKPNPKPKPASKTQQVPRRTGKQPASKNQQVAGQQIRQQIGFLSMEDLLNECEVDEDSRGALLGQLNKRMEYGEAMAEETLQKIRDETNEHLKFIVAEHSKWSRLYNEIKYKAQIEDSKTRKQMAKTVVVQIHDIQMKELQFVQTFKPGGHFCDDVLEIFRLIWKESWKPDTIMLSRGAVDQLLGVDNRSGFLEREFKDCTIAEIKTIFVPFISSDHCSLVVVEPDIRLITVLDSLFDLEESTKRHERLISALKSYLSSLGLECTDFLSSTPRVQKQKNLDDCGFHMLLFIMRYKSGNYKNIDEDEILICRQHTAWFLLEHEDNVLRGTFTKGHSKRRLEDKDRGENKKQKVHQKEKNQEAEKSNEDQDQDQQGEVSDQDPDQDQDQDQQGKGNDGKKETTKKGNSKKKNKSLDGRSVKDALLAPIRKVEVVKGGCSVVSPFTKNDTWTQNLGDEELRLQLWKKIVLNDEFKSVTLMRLHKVTRVTDGWHLSGHDISKSFGAKSCCQDILVSFFIQCLLADEVSHGDDTVGYRIFLDPKISELLLASKDAFNINSVVEELKLQYTDQQILKARHILLPVCHDSHWTVYVINKNFGQIDILDSSWATVEVKRKNHRTIAGVIRSKLSDAILLITDKHPKFSEWSMPIIPASSIAQQKQGSVDCGFFVMMFLKYYNPDTHRLEFCDLKEDFKCKILWYLLHHKLNASADSRPWDINL